MLAEPEEPVKRRMEQIRENRKKAEENRVRHMLKRQKQADMITAIAAEVHGVTFMLHDLGKWFKQFDREETVAQATQFEYTQCRNFRPAHGRVRTLFILIFVLLSF